MSADEQSDTAKGKAADRKAVYVVFMKAHIAKSHTPPSLCVHDHDLHTVCMHMNSYVHFHGENHVDHCGSRFSVCINCAVCQLRNRKKYALEYVTRLAFSI